MQSNSMNYILPTIGTYTVALSLTLVLEKEMVGPTYAHYEIIATSTSGEKLVQKHTHIVSKQFSLDIKTDKNVKRLWHNIAEKVYDEEIHSIKQQ